MNVIFTCSISFSFENIDIDDKRKFILIFFLNIRHICFQSHVDWDSFNTLVWMLGYIVCLRIVNVAELYFVHHFNIIQSLYTNLVNNLDLYIIVNKGLFLVCTIDNNRIRNQWESWLRHQKKQVAMCLDLFFLCCICWHIVAFVFHPAVYIPVFIE